MTKVKIGKKSIVKPQAGIRISTVQISDTSKEGTRGILQPTSRLVTSATTVAAEKLAQQLSEFRAQFSTVLDAMDEPAGRYQIHEVKVTLELSAEGEISILGSGVTAGGKAGLELTFKRSN